MYLHTICETEVSLLSNMDVTPVSSSSKCTSSDFSIERILSDETRRAESEVPSWLCCTRYQPPRIPRAVSSSRCRRSGRHARVPFTGAQAAALEAAYARAPYLAPPALRALAAALQLRDDRIKIWFQNRRARERREKSASIVPPLPSVPLPATTSGHRLYTNTWDYHTNQMKYDNRFKPEMSSDATNVSPKYRDNSTSEDSDDESNLDVESVDD